MGKLSSLSVLLTNRFARQVATLAAGSALAQAIPLVASPIITRLYSAAEFGIYVVLLAIAAVLLTISNLRYDAAIVQAKRPSQIRALFVLGCASAVAVNLIFALLAFLAIRLKLLPASLDATGYWLLAIPVLTIGNAVQNMLVAVNVRDGAFKSISIATIQKALASTATQVVFGWLGFGLTGLIAGSLVASLAANRRLMAGKDVFQGRFVLTRKWLAAVAGRFSHFPLYTMPGTLINSLALNSVPVILGLQFSAHDIGQFGLAQRSSAGPMKTISDAVGQVFLQRASERMESHQRLRRLYLGTAAALAIVAFVVLFPVSFYLESIFAFVFGANWRMAGTLAIILLPLIGVRFVVSPISVITNFRGMNAFGMFMQLAILGGNLVSLWLAWQLRLTFVETIRLNTLVSLVTYALFGLMSYLRIGRTE